MMDILANLYPWLKVLHLGAIIAWMAGLMYLPRLMIYHYRTKPGSEMARTFETMEQRLAKIIMRPAMVATLVFGALLAGANPAVFSAPWFYVKLAAVIAMVVVHGIFIVALKKFATGPYPRSEKFWRIINEVPFALLLVILIMVVVKPFG